MRRGYLLSLSIAAALIGADAWAQPADTAKVKALADEGVAAYKAGEYEKALTAYREAYLLDPNPGFLLNLGLCYDKLGRAEETRESLRAFLSKAPADHPLRPRVEARLARLAEPAAAPAAPSKATDEPPKAAAVEVTSIPDQLFEPLPAAPPEAPKPPAAPKAKSDEPRPAPKTGASPFSPEVLYVGAAATTGLGLITTGLSLSLFVKAGSSFSGGSSGTFSRRGHGLGLAANGLFITAAVSAGVGWYLKERQKKKAPDAAAPPAGAPAAGRF